MRRIGSNIRKQSDEARANRPKGTIIVYTTEQSPKNEYPKKIISPPQPSACCIDENRDIQGSPEEIEGFNFHYKVCSVCGHAVKFYTPAVPSTNSAVLKYRKANRYLVQ